MNFFAKREAHIVMVGGTPVACAYGKSYRPQACVEWGSVTKLVTAHAVARLVQRGDVDYSTPVVDLLGVLPRTVTIGSLVDHTSGLPRVHAGMPAGVLSDPYAGTDGDFVRRALAEVTEDSVASAGSVTYSNLGYAVLGLVIEEVTNTDWFSAVTDLVLDPLGIEGASKLPPEGDRTHILGFDRRPHQPWALANSPYAAAGGLWSPLTSMAAYGEAVRREHSYADPRRGWQLTQGIYWHNGQTRDSGAFLGIYPERDMVVATSTLARLPGAADRLGWSMLGREVV